MAKSKRTKWTLAVGATFLVLALAIGGVVWARLVAKGEQSFENDLERFKYGSLNSELLAGIPYPLFSVLPRVFPDLMVEALGAALVDDRGRSIAEAGYRAFGMAWEEGEPLPVGLSIRRHGPERVTLNCAVCHTTVYRLKPDESRRFAVGGPSHTFRFQEFLRFLFAAANDRRFTGSSLLPEMRLHFDLDWIDRLLYRLVILPKTRAVLLEAERQLDWMESRPGWGPGRDDAFNLPKFVLTQSKDDGTIGNTDFPAIWRMGNREGHPVHWGGEAPNLYASVATSAFGVGSLPTSGFEDRNLWIVDFLSDLSPPDHPKVDAGLAAAGEPIFEARCAECHALGGGRVGRSIPVSEVGTDRAHVDTWTQKDADRMNVVTKIAGIDNGELQGSTGYVARPLVGVWLLGPYLHNGSVPTLWDLLSAPEQRPAIFHRGYDVVDLERVGFVSSGAEAELYGQPFDTSLEGNRNGGHSYGVDLSENEKAALIEYLKTL